MHRFYLAPPKLAAAALELENDEAYHLTHILRAKVGERVTVFDGRGNEALCAVTALPKKSARLDVLQRNRTPSLPYTITLAQALPKGAAMDHIVQKATELGSHVIQPLLSDRSVVRLTDSERATKQERWRQIAIEACKQCGNNWLPEIVPIKTVAEFLCQPLKHNLKLIGSLQPDARPLRTIVADSPSRHLPVSALLLIGPEGDFTPAELNAAQSAGCQPLSLGPLILRSETAAIAALATLGYELSLTPGKP